MSATLYDSATTTSAEVLMVLGYTATAETTNVVHRIIGQPIPDISLHVVQSQQGQLSLLAEDAAAAELVLAVLASSKLPLSLVQDGPAVPGVVSRFIPTGQIGVALDEQTLIRWVVTVDFTEV